jgi:ubiquinone/menaquinone biosynthesis C-methylase UbiE
MKRSPEELAQTERLELSYANLQTDVMLAIERQVCGCDYGGNSWSTRDDAQKFEKILELKPGLQFLDLGAGSGWPGLYLAKRSGCDLTLVDLPLTGLKIASDRASSDQLTGACSIVCANATNLPFNDGCFDALSHSDLLCCLKQKRAVFESCKRVLSDGGRMAFAVISIAANLNPAEREEALALAPEFVESEADYLTLLAQTGWSVIENQDISDDYAASCRRQVKAMRDNRDDIIAIMGQTDFEDRLARNVSKDSALNDGRLRRELFVARPA